MFKKLTFFIVLAISVLAFFQLSRSVFARSEVNEPGLQRVEQESEEETESRQLSASDSEDTSDDDSIESPETEPTESLDGDEDSSTETTTEEREAFTEQESLDLTDKIQLKLKEREKELSQKRLEMQKKMKAYADEEQKKSMERITEKLNSFNKKMVEVLGHITERSEALLAKIKERTLDLDGQGTDVAAILADIMNIDQDLQAFKVELEMQSVKTYVPTLSAESAVRSDFSRIFYTLQMDLKALRTKLVNIKQEMAKVLASLGALAEEITVAPTEEPLVE